MGGRHVFGYPGDGINGLLGAFSRADDQPRFIQSRHEEMAPSRPSATPSSAAARASAWPRPGPGAIHLLNGLYDAKLDHVPVVAIVGQTNRTAMGGSYQQEVDLLSLFKDVASDYVQMVTVPEQLPNVLDRAIRIAMTRRAPTALIIPNDVQELEYAAPTHEFKMVPSSLGIELADASLPDDDGAAPRGRRCSTPAAGSRCWSARAPAGRAAEVEQVADLLGAGVAKALLGKDVLCDELPCVTGSIGLLGTRPSYEMMRDCDTLLTVGSSFPYTQFLPELDQARAVQIDIDGALIGMRYPYEVNLVGDAAATLRALIPLLERKEDRSLADEHRATTSPRWWETMDARGARRRRPGQPDADLQRVLAQAAGRRDRRRRQRVGRQLVRPPAADARRHARLAVRDAGHDGARRCPTPSAPSSPTPTGRRSPSRATAPCR